MGENAGFARQIWVGSRLPGRCARHDAREGARCNAQMLASAGGQRTGGLASRGNQEVWLGLDQGGF